jgi:hypothetical protein
MTICQPRVTETGGRDATTRHIPPKLALAVGMPATPAPKGWQWAALTSLARLESGHTPSRRHPEYWGGHIPWIGIGDAKANDARRIEDTQEKTNDLGIENSSARVLPEDTVCLSRTASVGYVVVMGRPMATSQDFVNWICTKNLHHDFLKYLFIAEGDGLLRFASGAVHQTIYFPEVKAFHICYPPLSEQERIVGILDEALSGIASAKRYVEEDFNKIIEIKEREVHRVKIFMGQINQNEKTLVFCATQDHALAVRDLVNQLKTSRDPNYCQRVTANDGALGEQHLRDFQDNERTIPTALTTSQKLSTGVDARNIRNIVLMRPINSIIEFKQIIGRGTRLYDGKDYFTIYDFVKAHQHFSDHEWDGEPIEPEPCAKCGEQPCVCEEAPPQPCPECGKHPCECQQEPCPVCGKVRCVCGKKKRAKVRLADGKERTIQHMMMTTFWHPDGTPMSAGQFMEMLFGKLPEFFKDEAELRAIWSLPATRAKLLAGLADKGFADDQLAEMQKIIEAERSDLFDVLAYVAYASPPLTREERADRAKVEIRSHFSGKQQGFLDFVLSHYVSEGVRELDQEKLTPLLRLKYQNSIADAVADLGKADDIAKLFAGFQKFLYQRVVAEAAKRAMRHS